MAGSTAWTTTGALLEGDPTMRQNQDTLKSYIEDLENLARGASERSRPDWVKRLRWAATERFVELGFPSTNEEAWRFTNVAPIAATPFRRVALQPVEIVSHRSFVDRFGSFPGDRLVFVDGLFRNDLSALAKGEGKIQTKSLADTLQADPESVEPYLTRAVDNLKNGLEALNLAHLQDGAVVQLPPHVVREEPLHIFFFSTAREPSSASYPRNLILAGAHSQATIVEHYTGPDAAPYFTNAMTEVVLLDGAILEHYKLQEEGGSAFHVGSLQVSLARAGRFTSHAIALGSQLARNNIQVLMRGEGSETVLNGLYVAGGHQHVDHHTHVAHMHAHCSSTQRYKGILDGSAHGVFTGRILVHPQAQKSNAQQWNRNLLLSGTARIDTQPQLEINADDVKCSHGATIGRLDEEALFYMRARGIDEKTARLLLTVGFAQEVIDKIGLEAIHRRLRNSLHRRFSNNEEMAEPS